MSLSYTFKSLAAFLFVLFWGWELSAVPSYPRPIRVEQPDGTTMTVRLYGDERFNYVTTVDGYNLVAENGVLYYAQVQGTKLVSTGVQAHDPMNRTNEERRILSSVSFGYPHGVAAAAMVADAGSGVAFGASPVLEDDLHLRTTAAGTNTREEFRSLVILVSFSDRDFSISNPRDAFDRMLNEEGYSENNAMGSAPRLLCGQLQRKVQPPFRCGGAVPAQPVRVLLSGQRRAVHHRRLQPGAVQRSGFFPVCGRGRRFARCFHLLCRLQQCRGDGRLSAPCQNVLLGPQPEFRPVGRRCVEGGRVHFRAEGQYGHRDGRYRYFLSRSSVTSSDGPISTIRTMRRTARDSTSMSSR